MPLDSSIAGVRRAAIGGAGRTAAETPGSARLLNKLDLDNELDLGYELYLDKLLHTAASSPPAAPGDGAAHRAIS